jgi:hypothetical protein
VLQTVIEFAAPMSRPDLRSKVIVLATVEALVSCEHTMVEVDGPEGGSMPQSSRIRVVMLAMDASNSPVRYMAAQIDMTWGRRGSTSFSTMLASKRGSNVFSATVPEEATANQGEHELVLVLSNGVARNGTPVEKCELLRRLIAVQSANTQYIIAGVLAAVLVAAVSVAGVYTYKHREHARLLIISLASFELMLTLEVRWLARSIRSCRLSLWFDAVSIGSFRHCLRWRVFQVHSGQRAKGLDPSAAHSVQPPHTKA